MQKCVKEWIRRFNELDEVEVYCCFYKRWMNCNLGECSQTCQEYYKNNDKVEYIYKIEIEYFKTDGKYHYNVLCREKLNPVDTWKVCALGDCDTVQDCFDLADYWVKRFEKHRRV